MYELLPDDVRGWRSGGGLGKCPTVISAICPECGERGNFSVRPQGDARKEKEPHLQGVWMKGSCPGCEFIARFIQVGKPNTPSYALYIHPSPKLVKQPIPESANGDVFVGRVRKTYVKAVHAYNAKQWTASAMMCGRALEGITKAILPEEKRKLHLASQLKELPNHIELTETISDLTDAIRRGRNIAAHYDEVTEIDEPTAAMLLELFESAVEYLFMLPGRIEDLDNQLKRAQSS